MSLVLASHKNHSLTPNSEFLAALSCLLGRPKAFDAIGSTQVAEESVAFSVFTKVTEKKVRLTIEAF